jgi:universal stress protein E
MLRLEAHRRDRPCDGKAEDVENLTSILVVLDRGAGDLPLLTKAMALAGAFGARLELFSCDAEHEYALRHSYDRRGLEAARQARAAELHEYLQALGKRAIADRLPVAIDVMSESPLYEAIVEKVISGHPDLVMKSAVHKPASRHSALGANDWQLVRACPAPLMFDRGRSWGVPPRFAAAVDVSEAETPGLGAMILRAAALLRTGCGGELDVLFGERSEASERDREEHARNLRSLAKDVQLEAQRIRSMPGDPAKTLAASAAEQRYDVLVLGALTHRTRQSALVGTLTRQLMEALNSDFLLIRHESFASPLRHPDEGDHPLRAGKEAR